VDHGAFESQHAADGSGYAHAALRVVCAMYKLLLRVSCNHRLSILSSQSPIRKLDAKFVMQRSNP
jgi:hypothetical protein